MYREKISRHVTLGLVAWFVVQTASVHLLHHHPLSIFFDNANLASENIQSVRSCGEAALTCPMPAKTTFSCVGTFQTTDFCPVCLFLQNYHGQTSRGGALLATSLPAVDLLSHWDEPLFSAGAAHHAQPRAPPFPIV